jgi:hypothetical protein
MWRDHNIWYHFMRKFPANFLILGDVVSPEYLSPPANKIAKIKIQSKDGEVKIWHRMGDLGNFDNLLLILICSKVISMIWECFGYVEESQIVLDTMAR